MNAVGVAPRLLTLCLFIEFLFMQFLIRGVAFMTTVINLDPPNSPLKRGTLSKFPVPPFLRGARGDLTWLLHEQYCRKTRRVNSLGSAPTRFCK